jgi:predicted nucleic acid-binding Zn ribbon protein
VLSSADHLRDPRGVDPHDPPSPHNPDGGQSLGHYEMLWSCGFCGTEKLLAVTHRYCPQCGAPQDPTRRYFPSEDDKVAVQNHVYVGADRACPACQAPQSANARHCAHCGSPLEGANEVKRVVDAPPQPAMSAAPRRKRRWWLVALVVGAMLSLLFVVCAWKKDAQMTVAARRWERAIAIEEYRDVQKEAWRDQVPAMARAVSCHSQERSRRQIPDGETCRMERVDKGDGTFEEVNRCTPKYRSEPVYDQRCRYLAMEWTRVDEAVQRGPASVEPAWPALAVPTKQLGVGARREGARREHYIVELKDQSGGVEECKVAMAKWRTYSEGRTLKVKVGGMTGGLDCDSLP